MSYNPFMNKIGPNEYRCLFGVSIEEANSIFSGGGGGSISGGDDYSGVSWLKVTEIDGLEVGADSYSKSDKFKNGAIKTIAGIIKNSRAVKIKVEIENADGTVTTAELL